MPEAPSKASSLIAVIPEGIIILIFLHFAKAFDSIVEVFLSMSTFLHLSIHKSFPPNHFHSRPHSYRCHCIITIYTECSGISFTPVIIIRSTIFICQNIIIIIRNFHKYPVLVCKSLNRLRNSIISCSEYYLCIRVKRILFYFCVKRIIVGNTCILPQLRTIIKCPAFQLRS